MSQRLNSYQRFSRLRGDDDLKSVSDYDPRNKDNFTPRNANRDSIRTSSKKNYANYSGLSNNIQSSATHLGHSQFRGQYNSVKGINEVKRKLSNNFDRKESNEIKKPSVDEILKKYSHLKRNDLNQESKDTLAMSRAPRAAHDFYQTAKKGDVIFETNLSGIGRSSHKNDEGVLSTNDGRRDELHNALENQDDSASRIGSKSQYSTDQRLFTLPSSRVDANPILQRFATQKKEQSIDNSYINASPVKEADREYEQTNSVSDEQVENTIRAYLAKFTPIPIGDSLFYRGPLRNHRPHGTGRIYTNLEEIVYEGEFFDGKYDGKGKLTNFVSRIQGKESGQVGEMITNFICIANNNYSKDLEANRGILDANFSENGWEYYEGFFDNGKKHGVGELKLNDGRNYFGEFRDGLAHGYGLLTYFGQKVAGKWEANICVQIM